MPQKEWPRCQQCGQGVLLPLSDYGPHGSDIQYKVWACHNPGCGFALRIDKGQISLVKRVRTQDDDPKPRRG